jgi:hypothetical protein
MYNCNCKYKKIKGHERERVHGVEAARVREYKKENLPPRK